MKKTERKLQEISGSLLVSLPSEWTKQFKLSKGSKIRIEQSKDGTLRLGPTLEKKEETKTAVMNYDEFFIRRFFREYLSGNDFIIIQNRKEFSNEQRKGMFSFINKLMNVQVIEDSPNKLVLQNFKLEELSISSCFKRLFFLSKTMFDELFSDNNNIQINELDNSISRFYYILIMQARIYLEEGTYAHNVNMSLIEAMDYRMAAEKIERIGDLIKKISGYGLKEKAILDFGRKVYEKYEKALDSFVSKDFNKAVTLWKDRDIIVKEMNRLKRIYKNRKNFLFLEAINDFFQIFEFAKEIANFVR